MPQSLLRYAGTSSNDTVRVTREATSILLPAIRSILSGKSWKLFRDPHDIELFFRNHCRHKRNFTLGPADQRDPPRVCHIVDAAPDRGIASRGLNHRFGHSSAGNLSDPFNGIFLDRIDPMGNSQRTGKCQTFIDRVNDDRNGSDHQRILRGEKSDRTRSGNHEVLSPCQTGTFYGMNRYGKRFNHGKMLPRCIGRIPCEPDDGDGNRTPTSLHRYARRARLDVHSSSFSYSCRDNICRNTHRVR